MKKKYVLIYVAVLILFLIGNYVGFLGRGREPCEVLNYISTTVCAFTLGLWVEQTCLKS